MQPADSLPSLPPTYVEHLVNPQNSGDLHEAHAAGEAGSMVGGLGVRITLKYGMDGQRPVITEARGRGFGSPAPTPALSWLTHALVGCDREEALAIDAVDVAEGITGGNGFRPPDRAMLAIDYAVAALRSALGDAAAGAPADPNGPGILVCRCLGIGDRTIRAAIHAGAHDPESIGDACRASTGCRSCRMDVLALIDQELCAPLPLPDPGLHPVARVALVQAGGQLRSLGLPMEDAEVADDVVEIRLGRRVEGAMVSPAGAVAITRHVLREVVWDGVHVALTS